MSKFNSSVSTLGIDDAKVQNALMRLLENSIYNKENTSRCVQRIDESIRRLSQRLAAAFSTSFGFVATDLQGRTFPMAALTPNAAERYNVKVTFANTASAAKSCLVNAETVALEGGDGKTATKQISVAGNGSFTVDNVDDAVSVFIRIWR